MGLNNRSLVNQIMEMIFWAVILSPICQSTKICEINEQIIIFQGFIDDTLKGVQCTHITEKSNVAKK